MNFAVFVVPIDGQADVPFAFPLVADGVVFLGGLHEVGGVLLADVFDAEIVNDKAEADGSPIVLPETWANFALAVSLDVESLLE